MFQYKNALLSKKIPTWFGLSIVTTSLVLGIYQIESESSIDSKASDHIYHNLTVSNVTDNSVSISWQTPQKKNTILKYGISPQSIDQIVYDDRDILKQEAGEYFNHYVTIKELNSNTNYYFSPDSSPDQIHQLITGSKLNDSKQKESIISGYVETLNHNPAEGVLVYLKADQSNLLSTMVTNSGEWSIPLHNLKKSDLSAFYLYDRESLLEIDLVGDSDLKSHISIKYKNKHIKPIITLGQDYIF